MRFCGVVAEYNPFHLGHLLHLTKTRKILGEDCRIICCMSGNFTQRGEPALLPKEIRAEAAVKCGADLVVELPLTASLSSAEGFAQGAVETLSGMGLVTDLSFGAEDSDLQALLEITEVLMEKDTVRDTLKEMDAGISYAAARERALYKKLREKAALLSKPNNILAVEYLKALKKTGSSISPLVIERKGAKHDEADMKDGIASAGAIRRLVREKHLDEAVSFLPEPSAQLLSESIEQGLWSQTDAWDRLVLPYLIRLSPEELRMLPGASEGLEYRLYEAIRRGKTVEEICRMAASKRYPVSRIRRMISCAMLGISREAAHQPVSMIRVLAFGGKGRETLALARKSAQLPLITKPAHARRLTEEANRDASRLALATDLYRLTLPGAELYNWGAEWRQTPYIQKSDTIK